MASKPRARRSLAGRIAVVVAATAAVVAAVTLAFDRWLESPVLAGAAALLVTLPLAVWFTNRMFNRWSHSLRAVADGIGSLRDRDFSVSVTPTGPDEIGDLTAEYNSLGESLRRERLNLYQRELLLDTVVQTTPLALVLTNAERPHRLRQHRGAAAVPRGAQDRGHPLRRHPGAGAAAAARRGGGRRRHALHGVGGHGGRDIPPQQPARSR